MNEHKSQVEDYQKELLRETEAFFGEEAIPAELQKAFLETPRHLFVHRFESQFDGHWIIRSDENTERHLEELYHDSPLCIFRNENGEVASTVSQPSLVLYMIHLLDLKPGMSVFELGGGSGWHAAIMSRLVGLEGRVVSVEIIEDLVETAKNALKALKINNLDFYHADGGNGLAPNGPFDRGVFTASASELPAIFFEQIKTGGVLEFVMKLPTGHDLLCLLKKKDDHFIAEYLMPCSFVPVTGKFYSAPSPILVLENLADWPGWNTLSPDTTPTRELGIDPEHLEAFLDFCHVVCQEFRQFDSIENTSLRSNKFLCGIISSENESLTLLTDEHLLCYGSRYSLTLMHQLADQWVNKGMPEADQLNLRIYPQNAVIESNEHCWAMRMNQCTYLWSIEGL